MAALFLSHDVIYTKVDMRSLLQNHRKALVSLIVSGLILFVFTGNLFKAAADTAALFSTAILQDTQQMSRKLDNKPISTYMDEHPDVDIYKQTLANLLWCTFFLLIPLWFSWYLIICFGIRLPEKDTLKHGNILNSIRFFTVSRYVLATVILILLLLYRTFWWNDIVQNYLYQIDMSYHYLRWVLAWLLFACILLDWKKVRCSFCHMRALTRNVVLFLSVPYICMVLVEFLCASKLYLLMPSVCILNYVCWLFVILFLYFFLQQKIKPAALLTLLIAYFVGAGNYVVFQLRGSYVTFGDLTAIGTALEVAGNYTFRPGVCFWLALGIFLAAALGILLLHKQKRQKLSLKCHVVSSLGAVIMAAAMVWGYSGGMLYHNVSGLSWNYSDNIAHVGYVPFFLSNMHEQSHVECEGYSAKAVLEALDSMQEETNNNVQKKKGTNAFESSDDSASGKNAGTGIAGQEPNIIIIQNEAFSDLSLVYDLKTDWDTLPYIHSLKENTIKGFLNLSVMVGPTANTEFEVLTRSSLSFLPYGCIPYSQYIKHDIPSLVETLKGQEIPYCTTAYHSYYSSGYNRTSAYQHLGFDESVFENRFTESFEPSQIFRDYLTDEANFERVIELYEKSKDEHPDNPFFCFNVTIQNHGGYFGEYEFDEPVKITNFDAPKEVETYLSLIRMSDEAFQRLAEYFAEVDEPTILVMYGDHQPSFTDKDVELLSAHPAWDDEQMQNISRHYVPYVIWANYDIGEADYMGTDRTQAELNTLSANYLGSTVLQCAGLKLSSYDRYLLDLKEFVPSLSALGYWTADGSYYDSTTVGPYADRLTQLQKIQYNLLIDNKENLWEKFVP